MISLLKFKWKLILCLSLFSTESFSMSLKKRELKNKKSISIGILDTGYCLNKINYIRKNIIIKPVEILTPPFKIPCRRKTLLGRRFHGHFVLEEFLKNLSTNINITIHPLVIFDKNGRQNKVYWKKAFDRMEYLQVDFALIAAGLPIENISNLPYLRAGTTYFVAAGKETVGISSDTKLFPHNLHQNKNLILIGSFYEPTKKDPRLILDTSILNFDKTEFFLSGGNNTNELRGSSRAVSFGLAKAINLCEKNISNLKSCLKSKALKKEAIYQNKIVSIQTY